MALPKAMVLQKEIRQQVKQWRTVPRGALGPKEMVQKHRRVGEEKREGTSTPRLGRRFEKTEIELFSTQSGGNGRSEGKGGTKIGSESKKEGGKRERIREKDL